MRWVCLFLQCRWRFVADVLNRRGDIAGLYQCPRCKTLSLGSPDGPHGGANA